MKKLIVFLILALVLIMSTSVFVGCKSKTDGSPEPSNPTTGGDGSTTVIDEDYIVQPGAGWFE